MIDVLHARRASRSDDSSSALPDPWLVSPGDAARLLGVSRSKIFAMLASGELDVKVVSIGRCRRLVADDLRRWISERVG